MRKGYEGEGPFGTTMYITDAGTELYLQGRTGVFTEDGERAYKVYGRPIHNVRDIFKFEDYENRHLEKLKKNLKVYT